MQKPSVDSLEFGHPPQYPIESVDNALRLLLLLGERHEIRMTEASKFLGVASSTAHRLLAMLQYRGFIRQDPTSKAYLPGPALTGVAFAVLGRLDIPTTAAPVLRRLSMELRETVHVGMLDGQSVRFVAALESPAAVRVASRLGRVMPAHCTSTGKAMLAELSPTELRSLYPDEVLAGVTPWSLTSRDALEEQLQAVRANGYAVNREESEEGVASVAVPVLTSAPGLRLALNASAPKFQLPAGKVRKFASTLTAAAEDLARALV
ncbi:IclR family transcriptional regulator [Rhodococcoides fascians A21d2]|uniref:IclR family transcriptional regulator n=1 Tax=Nocardiaceae TaxID=85025 RepID=UPI000562605D|nr:MULTISPECIES: IclR family transcriptional regulator [Rhodococcus]OZC52473.1 IclR family transcriptional regulator [Rhodococcus sp. WWJCD1]QII00300.1 IclR family transcriptional regulator [Rhodococcus fascians A21d2]